MTARSVHLEFWFQMGPGRGGLNFAIERMPDKEERIVARRMEEHRLNMERVVAGVKELAESGGRAVTGSDGRPATIDWSRLPTRPCPVAESLDLFGDRWSMLVIRDVMNGVRRFDDLVARLGISRATLADRLRRLTAAGILVTAEYDSGRGRTRTEYRMSARGGICATC